MSDTLQTRDAGFMRSDSPADPPSASEINYQLAQLASRDVRAEALDAIRHQFGASVDPNGPNVKALIESMVAMHDRAFEQIRQVYAGIDAVTPGANEVVIDNLQYRTLASRSTHDMMRVRLLCAPGDDARMLMLYDQQRVVCVRTSHTVFSRAVITSCRPEISPRTGRLQGLALEFERVKPGEIAPLKFRQLAPVAPMTPEGVAALREKLRTWPAPVDPLDVLYDGVALRYLLGENATNQHERAPRRMTPTQREAVSAHWSAELHARVAASKARDDARELTVCMQIDADDL